MYWHPTDEERAASFTVSLSSPTTLVSTWPGSRSMGTKLVGTFGLSSGTVWVTVDDEDVDPAVAATWAERKAKLRVRRKDGTPNHSTRAVGFDVLEDDGSFYLIDLFGPRARPIRPRAEAARAEAEGVTGREVLPDRLAKVPVVDPIRSAGSLYPPGSSGVAERTTRPVGAAQTHDRSCPRSPSRVAGPIRRDESRIASPRPNR